MKKLFTRQELSFSRTHNHGRDSQSGQIAVIVLLLMVVMLTIGLSLASRTTEELFLSNQGSESARVFNAAESGVEEALSTNIESISGNITSTPMTIGDSNVQYTVTPDYVIETKLQEGQSLLVNVNRNSGNVRINWWDKNSGYSSCGTDDPASLIITSYYNDGGVTKARFHPVGQCGDGYIGVSSSGYDNYRYRYLLNLGDLATLTTKFIRIKAVYNDTTIRVQGEAFNLPAQFHTIRSTATNNQGDETRIVEVKRTLSTAPSFMEFALYTPGQLTH